MMMGNCWEVMMKMRYKHLEGGFEYRAISWRV